MCGVQRGTKTSCLPFLLVCSRCLKKLKNWVNYHWPLSHRFSSVLHLLVVEAASITQLTNMSASDP